MTNWPKKVVFLGKGGKKRKNIAQKEEKCLAQPLYIKKVYNFCFFAELHQQETTAKKMNKSTNIEQLFRNHYTQLLTTARALLHDENDSQDAVSDVFAKITENSTILPERQPERYLSICVRNRCLDMIEHMSVRKRVERGLTLNTSPTLIPPEEQENCAKDMIDFAESHFDPLTWKVFRLRFNEQMRYKDIATLLNISERTVYQHLSKALVTLKKQFNNKTY